MTLNTLCSAGLEELAVRYDILYPDGVEPRTCLSSRLVDLHGGIELVETECEV